MDKKQAHTIIDILAGKGLLTKQQAADLKTNLPIYHAKYLKQSGQGGLAARGGHTDVSVVDIIESLGLKLPGTEDPLTDEAMMMAVAEGLGLEYVKIDPLKLDSDVVTGSISRPYALKHQLVPIKREGNTLTIATSNPFASEGIEGLKQSIDGDIKLVVSNRSDIHKIVTEFFGFKSSLAAAHKDMGGAMDLGNLEQYVKLKSVRELDSSDKHVIKAVEYLIRYAYGQRASDIHIEPKRDHSLIRLRIDGVLHTVHKMPKAIHPAFVSRIKNLSRMDIAEKRRPQDGRIKTDMEGREVELRVSTLPVAFGEKVAIRIFDPNVLTMDLSVLGFSEHELAVYNNFIGASYGLMLITGPTGSGKTSTLYTSLSRIATPDVNVSTIEDPVEMVYPTFNQTSINPQIGISFASVLRTLLRQDPDIIMVGEIRDFETADNAIQAALTGHLVMSTLHTNDAPTAIARMMDLGVKPFLINACLLGVVAQRLVRKVCPHCLDMYVLSEDECRVVGLPADKHAGKSTASVGRGCAECRGTGYLGRTGLFEIMEMNDEMRDAVHREVGPEALRALARKYGFRTLRENAHIKLLGHQTTVDEIVRVLGTAG